MVVPDCSCLDSGYERKAIDQGIIKTPVFPENKIYLEQLNQNKQPLTYSKPREVWPLVIADMYIRNEEGAKKYSRYLRTDCPDDMLQHAYEEALDLAVYLKTQMEKNKNAT